MSDFTHSTIRNVYLKGMKRNSQFFLNKESKMFRNEILMTENKNMLYIVIQGKDLDYTIESFICPYINIPVNTLHSITMLHL